MATVTLNIGTFIAAKIYAPGDTIIHTDGVTHVRKGTTTTATAFAIGWGDGAWQPVGLNRAPKVTVYKSGVAFDTNRIVHKSDLTDTFTPAPGAVMTMIDLQAGGGGGAEFNEGALDAGETAVGSCGGGGCFMRIKHDGPISGTVAIVVGMGGEINDHHVGGGALGSAGADTRFGTNETDGGYGGDVSGVGTNSVILAGAVGGRATVIDTGYDEVFTVFGRRGDVIGTKDYASVAELTGSNSAGGMSFMGLPAMTGVATADSSQSGSTGVSEGDSGYGAGGKGDWGTGLAISNAALPGQDGIIIITEYF